jgi:translation elongation factor EF-1beta
VPEVVGLSTTSKFAVLDLAHLARQNAAAAPPPAPSAAAAPSSTKAAQAPAKKKAAAAAAAEDDDDDNEMDLGFDDDGDEEDAPAAAAPAPGSRAAIAAEAKAKRDAETEKKKEEAMARLAKKEANQRSLCNLEIKPWEASQDLKALYAKIKETVVMDGLKWSENCALVDVAFGVQKIVCTAVIPLSLSMDAIIDDMTEETFADEIQSMNMTSMSLL